MTTQPLELIIHIGPHKTGTTAIQAKLLKSVDVLAQNNWTYLSNFSGGLTSHSLADCLSTKQFDRAMPALNEISQQGQNVVISSENFSRLTFEQVCLLHEHLKAFNVKIVYYIRNPLTRLFSAWQEWIKHGYLHSFPEYLSARMVNYQNDPEANDKVRIERWTATFGKQSVFIENYEATTDIAKSFCVKFLPASIPLVDQKDFRLNSSQSISETESIRSTVGAFRILATNKDAKLKYEPQFRELVDALSKHQTNEQYVSSISASAEHGPFSEIELGLKEAFPDVEMQDGNIFIKRNVTWRYFNSTIWQLEPEVYEKALSLRSSLFELYGSPTIDRRLKSI